MDRAERSIGQDVPVGSRGHTSVGAIVLIVVGAFIGLVALGTAVGGGAATWVYATQRDADGFFTTTSERFETTTHAITSERIDLGARPAVASGSRDVGVLGTIRLRAQSVSGHPVFVGIARQDEVDAYLANVSHAELDDLRVAPFSASYRYVDGTRTPAKPTDAPFWVASAQGDGTQTLQWEPQAGQWAVVVMNADGQPGVAANMSAGATAPWVRNVGLGLLAGGLLGMLLGGALLVIGIVSLARGEVIDLTGPEPHPEQPVRLEGRLDQPLSRWLWLVKWVLLVPHVVVLAVLWIAYFVVSVVAFFAILFTGRYPRRLFEFNVGVLRWTWRVGYYGYVALGTDRYPPFSLAYHAGYPATLEIAYPERLSRGLVLIKWWLLAIPHYLVLAFIGGGFVAPFIYRGWTGLIGILVLFAAVGLLFSGSYPSGIYDFLLGLNRWVFRVVTYVTLLRDEYPPFRLDEGGTEPVPPVPSPAPDEAGAVVEVPQDAVGAGAASSA